MRALVEGTAFGAYDPGLRKSSYADRPEVVLVLDVDRSLHALAERQAVVSAHIDSARDLANLPPNELTPVALAQHALDLRHAHLAVESHGREWIEAQGMGAFAAVASGSAKEPQLIVLRYDPPGAAATITLGLVGKAITFDSGGISLKPPLRMQDMKGDMCGGGAVIEATAAIAELGLPVRILAVVASTENLQDGDAYRPGDILRAANGKTIEIINTDAEGRLLLADALHYARTCGRHAHRRLRDADRRDGGRARRPVRRLVLQRRAVCGRARRGGGRRAAISPGGSRCTRATAATSTRTSPT